MDVVFFGAGVFATSLAARMDGEYRVVAFCDNDPRKQGKTLLGRPIVAPAEIHALACDGVVLACDARYHEAVIQQLADIAKGMPIVQLPYRFGYDQLQVSFAERGSVIGLRAAQDLLGLAVENGSVSYDVGSVVQLERICRRYGLSGPLRGLHAGMSRSLGHEIYSAIRWGWSWVSVEPYPVLADPYPFPQHFEVMRDLIGRFVGHDEGHAERRCFSVEETDRRWSIGDAEIRYQPHAALEDVSTELAGFDVCLSVAVLEHVRTVAAFNETVYRLLRPGGLAVHSIDFRDHRDFSRPLDFLSVDRETWGKLSEEPDAGYVNRLRYSEQRQMFLDAGFEVVEEVVTERNDSALVSEARRRAAPEFSTLCDLDLEVAGVFFVLRKPAS
jgi:SAM-dependent methyltransferase